MSLKPSDKSPSNSVAERSPRDWSLIAFLLRPRVAIPLVLCFLPVFALLTYRTIRILRVPPTDVPFDIKPVLEFVLPDANNAFVEYRAANAIYVAFAGKRRVDVAFEPDEFEKAQSDGWEHATEPVRKWLDANRPFMELWRKGTAKPDAQYYRAGEYSYDTHFPFDFKAREFTQLVRLESSRLLGEGQAEEAWDWLRTSFRMSRHLGRHGDLLERLSGNSTHAETSEGIVKWASNPHVTADQLQRAMRELRDEQERTPPLSACLKLEFLSARATMASMQPTWKHSAFFFAIGETEVTERALRHAFANRLNQVDKPRRQRAEFDEASGFFERDPALPKPQPSAREVKGYVKNSIVAAMLVETDHVSFLDTTDREGVRDTVLLTVLALELFAREHGSYPEKLDELVPDFLPVVPEDNDAPPKTPLRYRRDADGALIYSVGKNGTDDGGPLEHYEDTGYRIGKPREKTPE